MGYDNTILPLTLACVLYCIIIFCFISSFFNFAITSNFNHHLILIIKNEGNLVRIS